MAKKKQAEQELSLFDDSFFDNTPVSQGEIQRTGYLDDIRQPLELPERKQAFHTALDKIEELKRLDADNAPKLTIVIPKTTSENTADTRQRAKRKRIKVSFADGTEFCDANATTTMIQVIEKIDLERIKKINIKIGGCPITTPHKKYNGQVKLDSGEWLTVPVTVKDKYKILRVISSLTHEPFEVRIIE